MILKPCLMHRLYWLGFISAGANCAASHPVAAGRAAEAVPCHGERGAEGRVEPSAPVPLFPVPAEVPRFPLPR